jgi:CheY-like chemotaxis protein
MIRALLAEDDSLLRELVATIFERLGFAVTRASSGGELLDCIADHEDAFDVIVTDIAMPWMTGLQVMHSARSAGFLCPVVVMTALRDPKILAQVASLGGRAVLLLKPFSLIELYAAIEAAIPQTTPLIPRCVAARP